MLDRAKVMYALQRIENGLFHDISDEISCARAVWQEIAHDVTFIHKVVSL